MGARGAGLGEGNADGEAEHASGHMAVQLGEGLPRHSVCGLLQLLETNDHRGVVLRQHAAVAPVNPLTLGVQHLYLGEAGLQRFGKPELNLRWSCVQHGVGRRLGSQEVGVGSCSVCVCQNGQHKGYANQDAQSVKS